MGSSKKEGQQYGNDPKGSVMNQVQYQQDRFNNQQGPMVNTMAYNYGRGSEANYGDYTDIMNQYRNIASGGGGYGSGGSGGGGGGGGGGDEYSAFTVSPGRASYNDPFESYAGMKEFSQTGGYSRDDIANMRARGTSPVRAAYGNAEREMARQRSLQGGYSPNAFAATARMAREQGQASADAMQNVEANLAQMRNEGRRFGLTGMAGIEGQRLAADVDLSKFNTDLDFRGQTYNADAMTSAQARNIGARAAAAQASAASAAASRADQLRALQGMTQLYGTTPGMAATFGNQLLQGVGMGGNFGTGMVNAVQGGQQLPGQYEQTMGRVRDIGDMAGRVANPIIDYYEQRRKNNQGTASPPTNGGYEYQDPNAPWMGGY